MVSFNSLVTLIISALACASSTTAIAINGKRFEGLSNQARDILSRATPKKDARTQPAPVWLAYSDKWTTSSGPPAPSALVVSLVHNFALISVT